MELVKVGVKGLVAALNSLEALVECGAQIGKDGKVGIDDLQYLVDLGKKYEVFGEAVKNFKGIPAEIKDFDKEELVLVVMEISEIAMKLKAVFSK